MQLFYLPLILFVIGIFFGIHMQYPWQICAVIVGFFYINSKYVQNKELEAIVDILSYFLFIAGMLIGDVYVFIALGNNPVSVYLRDCLKIFFVPYFSK
jgi:hypothetical protein